MQLNAILLTKVNNKELVSVPSSGQRHKPSRSAHAQVVHCKHVVACSVPASCGHSQPSDWGFACLLFAHPLPSLFFHCLDSVTGAWRSCVWGLMAGLRGLPAMGVVLGLGPGWPPVEVPGQPRHPLPYSDAVVFSLG